MPRMRIASESVHDELLEDESNVVANGNSYLLVGSKVTLYTK